MGRLSEPTPWSSLSINHDDPVEVHLAARLQQSALAHVADSTAHAYVSPWNAFVRWCGALARPRRTLPADELTVALYMQQVADSANSYATVKSASAAIAFFQKINLYTHMPTHAPEVTMVRRAAMRKFGLAPHSRKAPFKWEQIVLFATAYGIQPQGYCHSVVTTMCVIKFGAMCRFSDVSRLFWRNVRFVDDMRSFTLTFERRKNAQFRQGNKVTVSAASHGQVCPVQMLLGLRRLTLTHMDNPVFCGFNGRLVAARPGDTQPYPTAIAYEQYMRYLSSWFSGVLGISPAEFRSQYGSHSCRSGGASAAANAGVSVEAWGQHGDWASFQSQRGYMALDEERILSVSRAIMQQPELPSTPRRSFEPDVRTPSGDPFTTNEEDEEVAPEVEEVPEGAFRWSA